MATLLYGVEATDPPMLAVVSATPSPGEAMVCRVNFAAERFRLRRLTTGNVFERMKNAQPLLARKINHQIGPLGRPANP